MRETNVPETLVIHQKFTPGYNPKTFKQHFDHGGSLQLLKLQCSNYYQRDTVLYLQPAVLYLELLRQDGHSLHLKVNRSYKNIVMTCDNTKLTSDSEVSLLVYRDDGWTTAETCVG